MYTFINSVNKLYGDMKQEENGRYKSWEHCYIHFMNARKEQSPNLDFLSLHLAFYLASWGMYRGSSFLLQKDYLVHIPVVEEILKPEYNQLAGIECKEYLENKNLDLLKKLNETLVNIYNPIRLSVRNGELRNNLSSTLITKVLMGTLGCVPAYDRYFISGVKNKGVSTGIYNSKSILKLANFYEDNREQLEFVRKRMKINELTYPQMKVLDMGFWQIGYELDTKIDEKIPD